MGSTIAELAATVRGSVIKPDDARYDEARSADVEAHELARARSNVTKGRGSKTAALAMVFKLIQEAERRWRRVTAAELVAIVTAGRVAQEGSRVIVSFPNHNT